jgi:hypothetical protein
MIPEDKIRDTDMYLPTDKGDPEYINPTTEEIRHACYAFALDCPTGPIEDTWKKLFQDACKERDLVDD